MEHSVQQISLDCISLIVVHERRWFKFLIFLLLGVPILIDKVANCVAESMIGSFYNTSVTSTSCKYSSHLFGIEFSRDRERSTGSRAPSPRDALHLLLASHQPMSGAHIASSLNIFSRIRRSIGIEWPSSCYARHRARCGSARHANCVLGKEM